MNKDYDDDYYNEYVAINPSSAIGNFIYRLTKEQMRALLDGKILADPEPDEYGIIILMEEDNDGD
jgi:hypothetical protein